MLLADEPTGNLDTRTSIEVMGIFQQLNEERGITIVLITHEHDIAEYGTRIGVVPRRRVRRRSSGRSRRRPRRSAPRKSREATAARGSSA